MAQRIDGGAGASAVLLVDGRVVLDRGWSDEIRALSDRGAFDEPSWATLFGSGSLSWRERVGRWLGGSGLHLRSAAALVVPPSLALVIRAGGRAPRLGSGSIVRLRANTTPTEDYRGRTGTARSDQSPGAA